MLINKRCTTCNQKITVDNIVVCETCGNGLHEQCAEYETSVECPRCAEDTAIGALEF